MKQLLIAGMLLMSVAAIHASNNTAKQRSDAAHYGIVKVWQDTLPTDSLPSDTTGQDTTSEPEEFRHQEYQGLNNLQDTIPTDSIPSDTTTGDTTLIK
jgi:hypothetical protein